MGLFTCCFIDGVDWLQDGPLVRCLFDQTCSPSYLFCCCIDFNWPFCPVGAGTAWMEKKYGQYSYTIYPLKEAMPCCEVMFPCCMVHSALRICLDDAAALIFIYDSKTNTLNSEIRRKQAYDTDVEARRSNIIKVHIEEVPTNTGQNWRQARYILYPHTNYKYNMSPSLGLLYINKDYVYVLNHVSKLILYMSI